MLSPPPPSSDALSRWVVAQRGSRSPMDPNRPAGWLEEQELGEAGEMESGLTILLTGRECPWRCVYCDLWRQTLTKRTPRGAIPAQIGHALAQAFGTGPAPGPDDEAASRQRRNATQFLKLYNAGSFFDAGAIPPEDHAEIARLARSFGRVVVECHPRLAGRSVPRFRDCLAPARLEVAMGLETAHAPTLERLNKRMSLDQFARAAAFLRENEVSLRTFILVQPPFQPDPAEALEWAQRSLDFAFDRGTDVAVLIPSRGGNGAMERLAEAGLFAPPTLSTFEAAVASGMRSGRGRVLADLWQIEALESCPDCRAERLARLREMNTTQRAPNPLECGRCG